MGQKNPLAIALYDLERRLHQIAGADGCRLTDEALAGLVTGIDAIWEIADAAPVVPRVVIALDCGIYDVISDRPVEVRVIDRDVVLHYDEGDVQDITAGTETVRGVLTAQDVTVSPALTGDYFGAPLPVVKG